MQFCLMPLAICYSSLNSFCLSDKFVKFAGPDFEESPILVTVRGLEPANARLSIQPPAPLNPPLKGYKVEVLQAEIKRKKSAVCYAPKRKVILDEYPDEVSPRRRIRPEVSVTPFKLSSQKENCVTRALLKDYTSRT